MWRNEFDPSEIKILTEAFDVAWAFVAASPPSMFPEPALSREILALKIMALARAGEIDKLKLANFALGELRQTSRAGFRKCGCCARRMAGAERIPSTPKRADSGQKHQIRHPMPSTGHRVRQCGLACSPS